MKPAAHIFISYVEENSSVALAIAQELRQRGYSTWTYEEDGVPGHSYLEQVHAAISECDAFVLLASPESLKSHQVRREAETAYEQQKLIIPIRLKITHVELQGAPILRMVSGTAVSVPTDGANALTVAVKIDAGLRKAGFGPGELATASAQSPTASSPSQTVHLGEGSAVATPSITDSAPILTENATAASEPSPQSLLSPPTETVLQPRREAIRSTKATAHSETSHAVAPIDLHPVRLWILLGSVLQVIGATYYTLDNLASVIAFLRLSAVVLPLIGVSLVLCQIVFIWLLRTALSPNGHRIRINWPLAERWLVLNGSIFAALIVVHIYFHRVATQYSWVAILSGTMFWTLPIVAGLVVSWRGLRMLRGTLGLQSS